MLRSRYSFDPPQKARGGVDARAQALDAAASDEAQRFEGERLVFGGATGAGRLEGPKDGRARVTLGTGDLAQRIAAPTMDFTVSGGRIASATLAAPVTGMFHVVEHGRAAVERYVVKSEAGPLVVQGNTAVLQGTEAVPVVVVRSVREKDGAPFDRSLTLASPTVRLETDGADLGRGARAIRRFDAEGPQTRVEVAQGGGGTTRAMGDRITYEPLTSRLRLTGSQGVQLLSR